MQRVLDLAISAAAIASTGLVLFIVVVLSLGGSIEVPPYSDRLRVDFDVSEKETARQIWDLHSVDLLCNYVAKFEMWGHETVTRLDTFSGGALMSSMSDSNFYYVSSDRPQTIFYGDLVSIRKGASEVREAPVEIWEKC